VTIFLVALGAMKLTELAKEALPWTLQGWAKSVLSLAVAAALAPLAVDGWGDVVLVAVGGAGLAALLHELRSALSLAGDYFKQVVILRSSGRRRA
jgi:hypothetical protein